MNPYLTLYKIALLPLPKFDGSPRCPVSRLVELLLKQLLSNKLILRALSGETAEVARSYASIGGVNKRIAHTPRTCAVGVKDALQGAPGD